LRGKGKKVAYWAQFFPGWDHPSKAGVIKLIMRQRRSKEAKVAPVAPVMNEARLYEEHALTELKNAGYRITMPRVQVIRALSDSEIALSAYAIHEKIVTTGGKIDVVSVYRILSTLQEVGLIHHIGIVDGYFPARTTKPDATATEVVVDVDTDKVRELTLPSEIIAAIDKQAKAQGFEAHLLKVEIRGKFSN